MSAIRAYPADRIFDGETMQANRVLLVEAGRVAGIAAVREVPAGADWADPVPLIAPGFVDLQVNGGDGVMLSDAPTVDGLRRIAQAHGAAGTTALLPTLITDTDAVRSQAVAAVAEACAAGVPGIIGLHLEGPHLSPARKGAHRGDLIRPMTEADLGFLCKAAGRLPVLKVTLSPEAATPEQIEALNRAGVIVSIGHAEVSFDACAAAAEAGAACVTHLFNAMRQIGGRDPGVVGAALMDDRLRAGLIADGHHVHAQNIRMVADRLLPQDRLFLVTDAMAPFGTEDVAFDLNGRRVLRRDGTLRLEDGTLAGADLSLPQAMRNLMAFADVPVEAALGCATRVPAKTIGRWPALGSLKPGARADFLALEADLTLRHVHRAETL